MWIEGLDWIMIILSEGIKWNRIIERYIHTMCIIHRVNRHKSEVVYLVHKSLEVVDQESQWVLLIMMNLI